jgi:iron complex outermembrane receptor protein
VAFSARGFIENGVTWLYNGVRVPGSSNFSSRVLDTANYDRIEVLRGPAAVLNGEGGTGATINLISRAPSFSAQPFELDYAFSSYNSHRLHAGTGGAIKDDAVAYRADFSTNRYGSNVHGERTALDRFTGSLLFKLSSTLKLTLELDRLHDDVEDLYYGTPLVNGRISKSLRRINYNNLTDNKYKSSTTWLRANLEWQVAPDVEVRNQAYYYDSFRDWRDVDDFTTSLTPRRRCGATPGLTWITITSLVGNRLDALFKGKLGGMDNRLVVGTDINRTDFKTRRNGFPAGTRPRRCLQPAERQPEQRHQRLQVPGPGREHRAVVGVCRRPAVASPPSSSWVRRTARQLQDPLDLLRSGRRAEGIEGPQLQLLARGGRP